MFSTKFKQLGLKIQYYRQMKNISQVELADEAGISRSYLSKIETGKAQCSVPVLLQIAQVLNVDALLGLTLNTEVKPQEVEDKYTAEELLDILKVLKKQVI